MVDSVVTFLLDNVTQLLKDEANLLGAVKNEVLILENELKMINAFLKDTEGKRAEKGTVKVLFSQIRNIAYEAEDVIDTFIKKATIHRKRSEFGKCICYLDQQSTFHNIEKKIQHINSVISGIDKNRERYVEGLVFSGGVTEAEEILHKRRREVEEVHVVGFDQYSEELVKLLVEGDSQRDFISILGMGGLGKTTLAKKIYNNNRVKHHFDVCGWVYVSQKYEIQELLLDFLKDLKAKSKLMILKDELHQKLFQILEANYSSNKESLRGELFEHLNELKEKDDEEFKEMLFKELKLIEDSELRDSLRGSVEKIYEKNGEKLQDFTVDDLKNGFSRCLQGRRYLLVLDDIWDKEVWDEVKKAFPDNVKGSRILITSRIKYVALHASPDILLYKLPFLNEDDSWELFCKRVFRGGTCPPELVTLGKEITKSCDGLPLAIGELGDILAIEQKSYRIWTRFAGDVKTYLTVDRSHRSHRSHCLDILALSYNHLPLHLKPCFLYFGMYPKDFEITVRQLIQLWIAEGFIQQIGNQNVEDVAEEYLKAFIDQSMIQVKQRTANGGVKTCCIHDLLRCLCKIESAEQMFLEVGPHDKLSSSSKSRRLSIQYATGLGTFSDLHCYPSCSRSLLFFLDDKNLCDESNLKWLCKTFELVRVVDLGNMATFRSIPKKIEELILLRYLRIRTGELDVLPASICRLWNLETLDLRNSKIKRLPKEIWELQKLRHLHLCGPASLPRTENMSLLNLQFLTGIAINQDTETLLANARFPNVKKLGLHSLRGEESTLLSSLRPLTHLQTLKINGLNHLPSPESFHLPLMKITLLCKSISSTVMTMLGSLTNLQTLKIIGVNPVQMNLNCDESSFHQLEVFKMANLEIMHWNLGRGAMPSLQHLVIDSCKYLNMLPDELWCLNALRDVEILHPSQNLAEKLRQLQMKSGCKLQVRPPLGASN